MVDVPWPKITKIAKFRAWDKVSGEVVKYPFLNTKIPLQHNKEKSAENQLNSFSCFNTIPACDGQTERGTYHTLRHRSENAG